MTTAAVKRKEYPISPVLEAKRVKYGHESLSKAQRILFALSCPKDKILQSIQAEPGILRHHIQFWLQERRVDILFELSKKFVHTIQGDFELLKEMGEAFYALESPWNALFFFSQALDIQPRALSVLYSRMKVYTKLQHFDWAEKDLQAIRDLDQSFPTCYLEAYLSFFRGNHEAGFSQLADLKEWIPVSYHLFTLVGQVSSALLPVGLTEANFFEQPLSEGIRNQIFLGMTDFRYAIQFWTRNRSTPVITELCLQFSEEITSDFEVLLLLANYFFDEKNFSAARLFGEVALAWKPRFAPLLALKVKMFIEERQFDDAIRALDDLIDVDDSFPSRHLASLIAMGKRRYDKVPICFEGVADQLSYSPSLMHVVQSTLQQVEASSIGMPEQGSFWSSVRDRITALI